MALRNVRLQKRRMIKGKVFIKDYLRILQANNYKHTYDKTNAPQATL